MIKGLAQQFSLGNDQYPDSIVAVTNVLSAHKHYQKFYNNIKKNNERRRSNEAGPDQEEEKTNEKIGEGYEGCRIDI